VSRAVAALLLAAACSSGSGAPAGVLDERGFWRLVAQAGVGAVEDRAAVMTQLLSTARAARLEAWQQQLVARADELDTAPLAAAMRVVCGAQDADGFAADRGWLIAQGERVFTTARDAPDRLATVPDLPQACDGSGQAFLDAATARYSDLGFEPGGDAFPVVALGDPRGHSDDRFPLLRKRFG
jgi:hypothetical protein